MNPLASYFSKFLFNKVSESPVGIRSTAFRTRLSKIYVSSSGLAFFHLTPNICFIFFANVPLITPGSLADVSKKEREPRFEGKQLIAILSPEKKKSVQQVQEVQDK